MKTFLYISISLFVLAVLAAGFIFYGLYQFYVPLGNDAAKIVNIQKGQGVKEIAAELENQKLIRGSFSFETLVWLAQGGSKLQAGQYNIRSSMNEAQVLEMLEGGKIVKNDIQVTFPEGFTLKQIQQRLLSSGLASAQGLDKITIGDYKAKYPILSDVPSDSSLEGFLFPDTYIFEKNATQQDIIGKMLDNFESKISDQMKQDMAAKKTDIFKVMTLASIVEKEVSSSTDRKIVAGIFWQRLADNYPLQSDATLTYIFDDNNSRHTIEQTKVDSPYNTYKYAGLPPGPINSPGLDAISAAIYPQDSPYYYFLTKPDTGEAVFAKTLDEQNKNIVKYLK